jgi:2',3'-cyclic-nucleotide 2'-phosphodiesterase (5'-nucleotidase family)
VAKWTRIAEKSYASIGFNPKKLVLTSGTPFDGRETEIRRHPTNLTNMIVSSIESATPLADIAIINSGSIRVDDILQMPVTQYDILRSLPFGGGISEVDMKGNLLTRVLEDGRKNVGIGGFLHYSTSVKYDSITKNWLFKTGPIDAEKSYRVAITDFLLTGGEANMDYLKPDNPGIKKVYPTTKDTADSKFDIRLAIINYLSLSQHSKN